MSIKFNPFQPNGIASPELFAGRSDMIRSIATCLFQAKNGNPQHFLLQGERGIGKSSLLAMTERFALGQTQVDGIDKLKFAVLRVDLGTAKRQLDVVRAIGRELKSAISDRQSTKDKTTKLWDFLSNWEVLGVRYHKVASEIDPEDARDELVDKLSEFAEQLKKSIDGVFIIMDEVDNAHEDVRLGEFAKLFTERLSRKGSNSVLLGIAGLPTLISKLKASHESSARIFEVLKLSVLTPSEREEAVRVGLELANKKNSVKTGINSDALSLISDLSEGYPHFVQQFAYFAFAQDDNDLIDVADVKLGAYKENGALTQLGDKYFSEMFHARIASEDYRKVLATMAERSDSWVDRKWLVKGSSVSESIVDNALAAMKARGIIIQDTSRRGVYRLPSKSFAAWITAVQSLREGDATEPNLLGE
jgi:DNA polymerase III delta prime subunit